VAMIKTNIQKVRELQVPTFTQWETRQAVQGIIAELESGVFYDAALLVSQMMRDDRINAVMRVRINSMMGMPKRFDPAKDTAQGRKIAEQATEQWEQMIAPSQLVDLIVWSVMLGVGVGSMAWELSPGRALPSVETWHPASLWFNTADDTYVMRYMKQVPGIDPPDRRFRFSEKDPKDEYVAAQAVIPKQSRDWILATPYGYKYGRLNGLVRPLADRYLERAWSMRDRARHSERHGMPFLKGVTPSSASQEDKNRMRSAMARLGSESVFITPQGTEGDKYDVELVESKSDSHEVFAAEIQHLDSAIAIVILGQSESTEGKAGLGAQEKPGDTVRRDIMRFDAACVAAIARSILRPWAEVNFGDADLAPQLVVEVDPPEDASQKAQAWSFLGDAVMKLEKYGVDVQVMLEESGAPMLPQAEIDALKAEQQAQKEAMAGALATNAPPTKPSDTAAPAEKSPA
jgi:phage gp29-like protein